MQNEIIIYNKILPSRLSSLALSISLRFITWRHYKVPRLLLYTFEFLVQAHINCVHRTLEKFVTRQATKIY